jgi:hypothetical protein
MRFVLYTILGLLLVVTGLFITDKLMAEDYYDCSAYFETDKEIYRPSDTIRLTLTITTEKAKDEIKLFDSFDNLDFSSHFTRRCYPENPDSGDCAFKKEIHQQKTDRRSSTLKAYQISPGRPFRKTFIGRISYDTKLEQYSISFPDLGYQCSFPKEEYEISKTFGFIGYLNDIRPAFGVSNPYVVVQFKSIRLKS